MDALPIVRIEIEGIRRFTCSTLLQRTEEMNSYIQSQIDIICTPEYLTNIINSEVKKGVDDAIRQSVISYYKHGKGSDQIRDLVDSYLKKEDEKDGK